MELLAARRLNYFAAWVVKSLNYFVILTVISSSSSRSKPAGKLQVLIEKIRANHADLGLAFDGDGDRFGGGHASRVKLFGQTDC